MDLTKITTPFGLLDPETQEALKAHGGPIEWWCHVQGWVQKTPLTSLHPASTYRVKPAPPKPREWWLVEWDDCGRLSFLTKLEAMQYAEFRQNENARVIHVREVLE